jgi:DNA-binding NtrC family response regulator
VGSNKPRDFDIRLICATNMPIHEMVAQKEFRQDLLYRINTVEIYLPPLRDRQEDIPLLTEHFLQVYAQKYRKPQIRLNASTLKKLQKYSWPGNIRELQHAIERAIIMSDTPVLQPTDFLLSSMESREDGLIFDNYNLEEVEKTVIRKAITKHAGNISQAARELGLTRASLYRRLEKYGL